MRLSVRRSLAGVCTALSFLIMPSADAADYYVARAGQTPTANYNNWGTAASNIATVTALAGVGDNVWVSNGTYVLSGEITVNGEKIRSFNNGARDRAGTIVNGNKITRCFNLSNAGALVEGFTITNGWIAGSGAGAYITAGTVNNCLIVGNTATNNSGGGGGVYLTGANSVVTNCDIVKNKALSVGSAPTGGGGVLMASSARVVNSRIIRNESPIYWSAGGGINSSGGFIFNCSIISNTALDGYSGGGVWINGQTTLRNCVIARNDDGRVNYGAGISSHGNPATIENCTIVNNYGWGIGAGNSSTFRVANTISYFNTLGAMNNGGAGVGILTASNCCATELTYVDAGTNNITTPPAFLDYTGGNYRLGAWSAGVDAGTNLPWMSTARDLDGNARISGNGRSDMGAFETTAGPAPTYYVARNGQTPGNFLSWGAAGSNIQQVVSAAFAGSTILISNGVYTLTNQIVIGDLTLRSFNNGAVDRNGTIVNGNKIKRCFTLNNANGLLEGLTISNGLAIGNGGGVSMTAGTLNNCLLVGNTASNGSGGGVYATGADSVITNCDLVRNWAGLAGGTGAGGGGAKLVSSAKLLSSRIMYNNAPIYWNGGGGVHCEGAALVANCMIVSNKLGSTYNMGGSATHSWGGGGVWGEGASAGTVRNCLIMGNGLGAVSDRGSGIGGRVGSLNIQNCTIVRNVGTGITGTDSFIVRVNNTISYNNTGLAMVTQPTGFLIASNCCATTTNYITSGSNNFTNNPQFADYAAGDYQLVRASPCVDSGLNQTWMLGATDLVGFQRIDRFGRVDRGAYEFDPPPVGTAILVR